MGWLRALLSALPFRLRLRFRLSILIEAGKSKTAAR